MNIYRLAIASLYTIGYVADAQTPATCVDPEKVSAANQQCDTQFETSECGGRNGSRGDCEDTIDQCDMSCGGDCVCRQIRTGCSSSITVTNCQLSTTYDIKCKSPLDTRPICIEGYTVYDTGGCKGRNELGSFRDISLARCVEKCNADDTCVSFEYNPFQTAFQCQLSSSCDRFSLTVNNKGSQYLWYARDIYFKSDAPTPPPTMRPTLAPTESPRPTRQPVQDCEVCVSGVTESDAVFAPLSLDPDNLNLAPTCGDLSNYFASTGDNIIVPCPLAPLSEEICCPGPGASSSALTTMRPNEAITASPTRKPVATTTPSSSPIKGTSPIQILANNLQALVSKSPTPPNNNQGISGLFDPSIVQPTRPTSSYLGPPMLQSLSNVPSSSLESSSVTMGVVETTYFTPLSPSQSPSKSPSKVPSVSPSKKPSLSPSRSPSKDDTVPPTQSPVRTDMTTTMSPTNSSRSSSIVLEDEGSPTSAGTESRLLAVGVIIVSLFGTVVSTSLYQ